jgi:hypothetical protein
VKQLGALTQLWRHDLRVRTSMLGSGDWMQALLASVAPFGWAWLLFGAQPAAAPVRSTLRRH